MFRRKNAVFDDLTVEDNLRLAGHILRDRKEFAIRRDEVLASLPALTPLWNRKPEKMSGGERQILALGMALLHEPRLLILDEPTAGLDAQNSEVMLGILHRAHITQGLTLIVVEHRRHECSALGGRLYQMRLGKLEGDSVRHGASQVVSAIEQEI